MSAMLLHQLEQWMAGFDFLPPEIIEYEVRFDPVSPEWINRVKNYLDLMGTSVTMTKSTDTFYPMAIRKEKIDNQPPCFMRKVQLRQTQLTGSGCRLAISLEKPLSKYDLEEQLIPSSIRYKKRWSYQVGQLQLDISHVIINTSPSSRDTGTARDRILESHEMEIELPRGWQYPILQDVADLIKTVTMLSPHTNNLQETNEYQRCVIGLRRLFQPAPHPVSNGASKPKHATRVSWPGVLPDTITTNSAHRLQSVAYAVTTKYDGARTILYIDYDPELGRVVVARISRNMDVHLVCWPTTCPTWIPGPLNLHLFPAVVDCEIMTDPETYVETYHSFDLLACSGNDIRSDPDWFLARRLAALASICADSPLRIKHHYWLKDNSAKESHEGPIQPANLFDPTKGLESTADGYIFTMVDSTYLGNNHTALDGSRNPDLLKWKPLSHSTVDFQIEKGQMTWDPNTCSWMESWSLNITTTEGVQNLVSTLVPMTTGVDFPDKQIVECRFDQQTRSWQPVRLRKDKTLPNFVNTVQDVLDSIESPVDITRWMARVETNR